MNARRRTTSRRPFYTALILIALVGAGVIAWMALRPPARPVVAIDPATLPEAEGYLLGDPNAPVQIIEYADFQCPACEQFSTVTEPDIRRRIIEPGLASFRFIDFPLQQHANAIPASLAAACANEQGQFWPYHDRLFAGQPEWSGERNPQRTFVRYARELGLDVDRFEECYETRRHEPQILANQAEGQRRGVPSTPTFIIGGRMVSGAIGYDQFRALVDSALARTQGAQGAPGAPANPAAGAAPATSPAR